MRVRRTGSSRLRMVPDYDLLAEDLPRDHEALDLARPLVDFGDLRVAVIALDRELLCVSVAAEDLDRLPGLPTRHLRRVELRLRPFLGMRKPVLFSPRRAVDQQARGVDLGRHVGELPLDGLELSDPLTECVPLESVGARHVIGSLCDAEYLPRDADPAIVQG